MIGGRRVFWGEDEALSVYNAGTMAKVTRLGPLPKPGEWTKLSFEPSAFDLGPGARVAALSVQQIGGRVAWDRFTLTGELSPAKDPLASFDLWWSRTGGKKPADVPEPVATTLTTPPAKVTGADVPMPYAANLEKLALPNVDEVIAAVNAVTYRS